MLGYLAVLYRQNSFNSLLRNIQSKFENIFDKEKLSFILMKETEEMFNPSDCVLVEYSYTGTKVIASTRTIDSYTKNQFHKESYMILKNLLKSVTHILDHNAFKNETVRKYLNFLNYENFYVVPVFIDDYHIMVMELYYDNKPGKFDKKLLRHIIYLFEKAYRSLNYISKSNARIRRDELVIKVLDKIRNTLDEKEIKRQILEEIGRAFKADRVVLIEYDKKNTENIPSFIKEYIGNPYLRPIKESGYDIKKIWEVLLKAIPQRPPIFVVESAEKFLKDNKLEGSELEEFFIKTQVKSSYPFRIRENDDKVLYLFLQYISEINIMDEHDLKILELLAKQINIALEQAELYSRMKMLMEKEKTLRGIISETKILPNTTQIYKYLLEKITDLFKATGTIIVEFHPESPSLDYKIYNYYKPNTVNIKEDTFPDRLFKLFYDVSVNQRPCFIKEIREYLKANNLEAVFEENNIKLAAIFPFITRNPKHYSALGLIYQRDVVLSAYQKDLLSNIIDSTSHIVKELTRNSEIIELREAFLSTLAHDLQIPLIAQRNAIEYLLKKEKQHNGEYRIVEELLETNQNLTNMLKNLLSIYNFEAGKYKLYKRHFNLLDVINEIEAKYAPLIKEKHLNIKKEMRTDELIVHGDMAEIQKVFEIIFMNAIDHTRYASDIVISFERKDNVLITCITDQGEGISEDIKKIIFQRNAMSNFLERKIGAGMNLYLAKLIISAHHGKIYFNTQKSEGSSFCVALSG